MQTRGSHRQFHLRQRIKGGRQGSRKAAHQIWKRMQSSLRHRLVCAGQTGLVLAEPRHSCRCWLVLRIADCADACSPILYVFLTTRSRLSLFFSAVQFCAFWMFFVPGLFTFSFSNLSTHTSSCIPIQLSKSKSSNSTITITYIGQKIVTAFELSHQNCKLLLANTCMPAIVRISLSCAWTRLSDA